MSSHATGWNIDFDASSWAVGAVLRQVQAKGRPSGVEGDRRRQSTHSTYPASLSLSLTGELLPHVTLQCSVRKQCLKYKTYSSIILNRFEALNLRLLTSMASPRARAVPTPTAAASAGVDTAESEGVKVDGEAPATTTTTTLTGKSGAGKKKKKGKK